jgi:hypothetical protein
MASAGPPTRRVERAIQAAEQLVIGLGEQLQRGLLAIDAEPGKYWLAPGATQIATAVPFPFQRLDQHLAECPLSVDLELAGGVGRLQAQLTRLGDGDPAACLTADRLIVAGERMSEAGRRRACAALGVGFGSTVALNLLRASGDGLLVGDAGGLDA